MFDHSDLGRLRGIGLSPALMAGFVQELQQAALPCAEPALMRVTEVQREGLTLHDGLRPQPARLRPSVRAALATAGDAIACGDWVLAERNPLGEWWVAHRLQPANQLARRLHDGRDKVERVVIVSNVDTALLVMGLDLDHSLRRLERYLALVQMAGVAPVVVLTKKDLCEHTAVRLREVQALLPPGAVALAVNALGAEPRQVLAPWLQPGQTLVLLGSSGAGKSTLTNALLGAPVQDTGASRTSDHRGRHTTTVRSLHATPEGACIIDTPGLRTLRLDGDAQALGAVFDDIAQLAPLCRFRDCRHEAEPGCAVREGVAAQRLRNFHKLEREAQRDTLSALERRAQQQTWKQHSRAARQRAGDKRGG